MWFIDLTIEPSNSYKNIFPNLYGAKRTRHDAPVRHNVKCALQSKYTCTRAEQKVIISAKHIYFIHNCILQRAQKEFPGRNA